MATFNIYYASTTGNTESCASEIASSLGDLAGPVQTIDQISPKDLESADHMILGISTWNIGELQDDWAEFYDNFDDVDLSGKVVALFGLGDQEGYPENFQDAMGILYEKVVEKGAKVIGAWPVDGYEFDESRAVVDGKFVGLALDEDNQSDMSADRIQRWTAQLKQELG